MLIACNPESVNHVSKSCDGPMLMCTWCNVSWSNFLLDNVKAYYISLQQSYCLSVIFLGPVKKVKKLYVENPSLPIPRRTKTRWSRAISLEDADSASVQLADNLQDADSASVQLADNLQDLNAISGT